jgi:isopentenyl diphosphate isomerase/L-lactate dehydrogenase-like FMN-dependent dehydrogenase
VHLCHDPAPGGFFKRKPMLASINMASVPTSNAALTWDFVRQLRKSTKMKLLIKGLVTHEDARLALECGADGVVVSNHGGGAEEIWPRHHRVPAGNRRCGRRTSCTILIDGGFRRGTDIYKALALGANAVCVGLALRLGPGCPRPAGRTSGSYDLLRAEFSLIMKQCGKRSIAEINKSSLTSRASG